MQRVYDGNSQGKFWMEIPPEMKLSKKIKLTSAQSGSFRFWLHTFGQNNYASNKIFTAMRRSKVYLGTALNYTKSII